MDAGIEVVLEETGQFGRLAIERGTLFAGPPVLELAGRTFHRDDELGGQPANRWSLRVLNLADNGSWWWRLLQEWKRA